MDRRLFYSYFKTLVGKQVRADPADPPRRVSLPKTPSIACRIALPIPTQQHKLAPIACFSSPFSSSLVSQVTVELKNDLAITGRGLHSFRLQLNLSSSVHRVTQLNPDSVLELLELSSNVNECKPLLTGTLMSVDQYLNIKLENTKVVDEERQGRTLNVCS